MDVRKQALKGSPSRDIFKQKHKQLPGHFYACDVDFVWVTKDDPYGIVAILDYKTTADDITFSEVLAYGDFIRKGIPVYIVTGDADSGAFSIFRFQGGNYRPDPPKRNLQSVATTASWDEFAKWQQTVRDKRKAAFA